MPLGRDSLIARLQLLQERGGWDILDHLAAEEEPRLRRILRPHAEAEFDPSSPDDRIEMQQRRQLDGALGALTWLEIGYQTGVVTPTELPVPKANSLTILFGSGAFLRYLDVYLYFGIRFLAGRTPAWMICPNPPPRAALDLNIRTLRLMTPPGLVSFPRSEQYFAALMQLAQRTDPALYPPDEIRDVQLEALEFLDGFTLEDSDCLRYTNEAHEFELWLRGLRPSAGTSEDEEQNARFERLGLGLTTWSLSRRDFYISLDRISSHELWRREAECEPEERRQMRPPGGWALGKPIESREPVSEEERRTLAEEARRSLPHIARLGLADLYWISKLLQAEVSASASVSYKAENWLHLLRFQAGLIGEHELEEQLWTAEEILRSVLDRVCDLVQNAVELTTAEERRAREPELFTVRPNQTWDWLQTFDEEVEEIERQRRLREFKVPESIPGDAAVPRVSRYWRTSVRTGVQPFDLVGLAFSGGGIRSATFNLGVLQGLQEFDVLSNIDYISTVSGGGFIGSWLVANVSRTRHWLGRLTNWDDSIAHLRRYSKYLAPRSSILSADLWTMWGTWVRNAFLIQITAAAWLLVLLSFVFLAGHAFHHFGETSFIGGYRLPISGGVAVVLVLLVLLTLLYNLWGDRASSGALKPVSVVWIRGLEAWLFQKGTDWGSRSMQRVATWLRTGGKPFPGRWVRRLAVLPAFVASFLLASLLWADATGRSALALYWHSASSDFFPLPHNYSNILRQALGLWKWFLVFEFLTLALIAFYTLSRYRDRAKKLQFWVFRPALSGFISLLSMIALYLQLCAILWLFFRWSTNSGQYDWYAFVLGPPLVLGAHIISVALFVGFCGRSSKEPIREWWTRYGTWLLIYTAGYVALGVSAVLAPLWMLKVASASGSLLKTLKWGAIVSWIGTVISGLLAGKSSKTSGDPSTKSPGLEALAKAGGLLFIVGAVFFIATVLYIAMVNICSPDDWRCNVNAPSTHNDYAEGACYWKALKDVPGYKEAIAFAVVALCGVLFSIFFEINIFGLNQFYRARLARCYLGATRWAPGLRKPQPFTNFDSRDDMRLNRLRTYVIPDDPDSFRGPFPIFNCALNLAGSSDLTVHTRHSASFSLTPLRCGADRPRVGYAPTRQNADGECFADGVMVGQAVAISGAAASPNMGYNTSPLVAFLLTMFNVRLGWWFPNPGKRSWSRSGLGNSLYYLVKELFGIADEKSWYVNVSDGGHFENLGIYELVRRRCKVIIASDGECDEALQFGSLGSVVRLCETDFGAKIDLNVSSIRPQKEGLSLAHCSVGRITYSNGSIGYLIYLKASITGDEDVGVAQYRSVHPSFPHETTADQFFTEDQFESYRRLGRHVVEHSLRGTQPRDQPVAIAEKLADVLAPAGCNSEVFLKHARVLDALWERFRQSPRLQPFLKELMRQKLAPAANEPRLHGRELAIQRNEDLTMGMELIQLMENVFLDLRLDDFWEHPDNRGWAILFMRWARSPRFRAIWGTTRRTFGIRFEYFCEARLGLTRDNPIVRV